MQKTSKGKIHVPIMILFAIITLYKRDTWLANIEFAEHGTRSESDLSFRRMKAAYQKDMSWKSMFKLQPPPDFVQQLTCMSAGSSMERLMNISNAMRGRLSNFESALLTTGPTEVSAKSARTSSQPLNSGNTIADANQERGWIASWDGPH